MKFDQDPEAGSGGDSMFVKLKDGESIEGTLAGEVRTFYAVFDETKRKSVEVPKSDANGKFRFKINLIVQKGDGYVVKILEQGAQIYKQFKEMSSEGYNMERTVVKIKRKGEKLETEYFVMAVPNKIVSDETFALFKELDLNKLD